MQTRDAHRDIPPQVRRSIARELASYYHELSDSAPDDGPPFSLARLLMQMGGQHGLTDGREKEICAGAATISGEHFDRHRVRIPWSAFATRDLNVAATSAGGFLVSTEGSAARSTLLPWSVVAQAGAQILPNLTGNAALPLATTPAAASWLSTETSTGSPGQSVLGEVILAPKMATSFVKFSRQLLMQGTAAEPFIRAQLLEAVGTLLDQAFFAGTGASGQPLGLALTPGVGTQSGTALAHAGIQAMLRKALTAGATENNVRWVGGVAARETLGLRERATGGGRFLWDDSGVLGMPSAATINTTADVLVCGDFSRAIVALWGSGVVVEIDPFTNFATAKISARVLLPCDVAFSPQAAFVISSSIT